MRFAHERPPQILLIVQERLKPNSLRAYDRAERDIANQCTRLKCPHPYLALESLSGPKEVWWLNAFASAGDKERVERAYKGNEALMAELRRLSQRKSALTHEPVEIVATYRGDLSDDRPCGVSGSRFFVITVGSEERKSDGSVFEAPDGRRFVFTSATTRREADQKAALAGSHARVFAIRPWWSYPADGWVAADPEFWRGSPLARSRPRGSG